MWAPDPVGLHQQTSGACHGRPLHGLLGAALQPAATAADLPEALFPLPEMPSKVRGMGSVVARRQKDSGEVGSRLGGTVMATMTVLILIVGLVAWFWARDREKHEEAARDDQWEIRYPELNEYSPADDTFRGRAFADFEQMLLVDETSDYNFHHTRVFHLRRRDGPVWEICEEADSRARSWAHFEAKKKHRLPVFDHEKEEENYLRDPTLWQTIGYPTLEPAYQRFVHQHTPSTGFAVSPVATAVAHDVVEGTPQPSRKAKT